MMLAMVTGPGRNLEGSVEGVTVNGIAETNLPLCSALNENTTITF